LVNSDGVLWRNQERLWQSRVGAARGLPRSDIIRLINDDFAAVIVETDIDVDQLAQPLADLGALFRIDQEHHEAAAAFSVSLQLLTFFRCSATTSPQPAQPKPLHDL
jgi:hypothetical protein